MTENTSVILEQIEADHTSGDPAPDNEWFNLKTETVEVSVSNNVIVRSILSTVGEIAAADPVLNVEKYQLMGVKIADIDATDYPDSLVAPGIPASDHNQRMESALRRSTKQWGPSPEGFDTLIWNDQSINVIVTDYSARESTTDTRSGIFTVDMELTHADAYVDQDIND